MIDLKCPKDQAPLRSFERNGVTIERCSECGGVFLDRGELEQLISAAEEAYGGRGSAEYGRPHDDDERYGGERRRRRGWLGDIFDIG